MHLSETYGEIHGLQVSGANNKKTATLADIHPNLITNNNNNTNSNNNSNINDKTNNTNNNNTTTNTNKKNSVFTNEIYEELMDQTTQYLDAMDTTKFEEKGAVNNQTKDKLGRLIATNKSLQKSNTNQVLTNDDTASVYTTKTRSSYKYNNPNQHTDITRGLKAKGKKHAFDLITQIAISDFEEMYEKHRLIKYNQLMNAAESSFIEYKKQYKI